MWRAFLAEIKYIPFVYCNPDRCLVEVHPGSQVFYGVPWGLSCLSCKTYPCSFVSHVEEKPLSFLSDPKRKTLSEETNLGMLQNFGTALNPSNGPMNSTCAKDLRGCSLNDPVFACSVCHCPAVLTFVENPDNGDDIAPLLWPPLRIRPLCARDFAALGTGWSQCHRAASKSTSTLHPVMSFSLSLSSKSQWCTFEIDLKRTALLVHVAWNEKSQNNFTK